MREKSAFNKLNNLMHTFNVRNENLASLLKLKSIYMIHFVLVLRIIVLLLNDFSLSHNLDTED